MTSPVLIARIVSPLSTSHTLAVPSKDPLRTRPPSRFQRTDLTPSVCPVHLVMTLPVSISHNLTAPSLLPLTNCFPSGDNAIAFSPLSPSRQSFPICSPLFKFHIRSEPSSEQVMIRRPPGRCMTPSTFLVCPSNFLRGLIPRVFSVPTAGRDIVVVQDLNNAALSQLFLLLP